VRDFCALQKGSYFVPDYGIDAIDKSYFLNHSEAPNLSTENDGESFFASRDIEKGEELTADYRAYHHTKRFKA
jgi:SET domain-containing protein